MAGGVESSPADVVACKFELNPNEIGVEPGADGVTKREPAEYGLVATRHDQEGSVFRVDYRTGAMSIGYFYRRRSVRRIHAAVYVRPHIWRQNHRAAVVDSRRRSPGH